MVLCKFPEEVLQIIFASSFKALFLKHQSKFQILNEVGTALQKHVKNISPPE